MREPFNQDFLSLRKLDPVSARLLFFRDPELDEINDPSSENQPPSYYKYERFSKRFKKLGYTDAHISRLWEKIVGPAPQPD